MSDDEPITNRERLAIILTRNVNSWDVIEIDAYVRDNRQGEDWSSQLAEADTVMWVCGLRFVESGR